jgi:predicted nucleotidyltransferase
MKTIEQYAAAVVEKYRVEPTPEGRSHRVADALAPIIKQWGKQYLAGLTISGAYAKNTAITLCSDLDVLVSLNPVPDKEMKAVFWNFFEFLTEQNLRAHTRDVSIQVEYKGKKVDLIPGYRDRGCDILFNKRTGHPVETDLSHHVHLIANSGRQQEICALKIWRERNELVFPSFYLELTVLRALDKERFGRLAENLHTVLRYLAGGFEKATIVDPENGGNVVSEDLPKAEKQSIANAARKALYDEDGQKLIW